MISLFMHQISARKVTFCDNMVPQPLCDHLNPLIMNIDMYQEMIDSYNLYFTLPSIITLDTMICMSARYKFDSAPSYTGTIVPMLDRPVSVPQSAVTIRLHQDRPGVVATLIVQNLWQFLHVGFL